MKMLAFLMFVLAVSPATFAQSTADMKDDASTEHGVSDKAMNIAYANLMTVLNEEGKKRLKEAQRAWIAYRDAQAGFDSHHLSGGTMEGLEQIGALNLLTQERTKRLVEDCARFKGMY